MPPQVSVFIPVYNGADFVGETIKHLLAQTFTDFELLVIDDGSTDNSADVAESFSDPRVRVIRKEHSGLVATLNRGVAEAKAPLLARNDHDDLSLPQRLAREVDVLERHPEALALFSFHRKIGRRRTWSNEDKLTMRSGSVRPLQPIADGCLLPSTMLARTEAVRTVGGFRAEYYPSDDWDLQLRLAQAGPTLVLEEPLVLYRFTAGSVVSRTWARMQENIRWAADNYQRRLLNQAELTREQFLATEDHSFLRRLRRRRIDDSKLHMRRAGHHFLDGNYLRAAGHLLASAMLNPGDLLRRAGRLFRRNHRAQLASGNAHTS